MDRLEWPEGWERVEDTGEFFIYKHDGIGLTIEGESEEEAYITAFEATTMAYECVLEDIHRDRLGK